MKTTDQNKISDKATGDLTTGRRSPSKAARWISWFMSGIVILFMAMDGLGKLIKPAAVVESTLELGYQEHHIIVMGILGLLCVLLYAIPRTTVIGALLLTAYFGGAIATNFRMDNPLFSHILFPVYLGILAWGGLWLRNAVVRTIIPFMKKDN